MTLDPARVRILTEITDDSDRDPIHQLDSAIAYSFLTSCIDAFVADSAKQINYHLMAIAYKLYDLKFDYYSDDFPHVEIITSGDLSSDSDYEVLIRLGEQYRKTVWIDSVTLSILVDTLEPERY